MTVYSCEGMIQLAMGLFSIALIMNACIGLNLLNKFYRKKNSNLVVLENLIESHEHDQVCEQKYNERLPSILKSNELSEKMFNKGWKFDQFNGQGQTLKQLSAVSVIFALVYFSMVSSIMK
jgi:hypothetical protein